MTTANPPQPTRNRTPLLAAIGLVFLCLAAGAAFVWYEIKGAASNHVTFSQQDAQAMEAAGQRLTFSANGGIPMAPAGPHPGPPPMRRPTQLVPDGVTAVGNWQVIRAGQVLVRVEAAPPPNTVNFVFRQRTWGLLQDSPVFTIARRVVHEDALAKQLAVSNDQLQQLTRLVSQPALKGAYIAALPVPPDDIAKVRQAWTAFLAARSTANPQAIAKARADLLLTVRQTGMAALAHARADYNQADKAITAIFTTRQIEAYREGKSLAPGP